MCLSLYDCQAKASRYRKGLTSLNNMATTNQNQTIYSQKLKRRGHKHKIKGNHPTKKKERKEKGTKEKHRTKWKTRLKGNKYILFNNYLKCQWNECSKQKTQSGRLDEKTRAYSMLPTRHSP